MHAEGRFGDCALDMASGQVRLDHVTALRGRLRAGEVTVGRLAGSARIDGGAAGVRIGEAEGIVRYTGSTGKVWIGHAWSDVDLGGASGGFDIDRADGSVTAKAGACPIRVGRMSRGKADLANASGGIEIGISEGTAARVDAESTKGRVRDSLPAQDGPGGFDDEVEVYARTRLDDIVIHPAAG
ncbi:hypothetical protein B0I33_102570 [Prauserella shujinwangii]|uniref:Adhesin n=1 Tax=Prauserella shujinwangii TaxID=1453103 RepID=A0A2T0M1H3_9PSEU|nr:hypothetical protein B0I33_102570 [Prauserella shujinwangii]